MNIRGGGTYTGSALHEGVVNGILPPYPGAGIIKPVVVPPPPLLKSGLTDIEAAKMLAASYRGAVTHVYQSKCFLLLRGDLRKSKSFSTLVVASGMLLEKGISPISWAHWSVGIWFKWKGRAKYPPVSWVYAPTRIDQKEIEFLKDCRISTSRVALTSTHKVLLLKYNNMTAELHRDGCGAVNFQKQMAAKYFPPGVYDRLVFRVNEEVAEINRRLRQRIEKGEWIW